MRGREKSMASVKKKRRAAGRKYSPRAQAEIARVMRRFKKGTLKSGAGEKVTDRKQAIAIGISEARRKGYKTPSEKETD